MKSVWFIGILVVAACSAQPEIPQGTGLTPLDFGSSASGQEGDGPDAGSTPPTYQQGNFAGGTSGSAGVPQTTPSTGGGSGGSAGSTATGGGEPPPPPPPQAGQPWRADIPDEVGGQGDDEEDAGLCGSVTVEADVEVTRHPGNLLIVFDRSQSMSQDWGGVPRYQAAGEALIDAITPMQDMLTVGSVFFPSPPDPGGMLTCNMADWTHWLPGGPCLALVTGGLIGESCVVTDITADDQLNFQPAADFIAAMPDLWFLTGAGMTPLEEAVNKADAALTSTTFEGAVAVVIMTDGEPSCGDSPQNVNATVARWLANGISTYVVGLPGSQGAADLLNQLATTGGTGNYLEPNDPAALQTELGSIVTETIKSGLKSCEINLEQEEDADVEKLHLVVTEEGVEKDVPKQLSGGGWSVNADGTVATLDGTLCEDAKNGRFESVRFDFGCVELPIFIE